MTTEQTPTVIGEQDSPQSLDQNPRSIFDFSEDELRAVIESGTLPDNTTLVGIENQEDFDKLWRFRSNASKLASSILRKRLGGRISKEAPDLKTQRFELKRMELELKAKKQESAQYYQKIILDKLDQMEVLLKLLLKKIY